MGKSLDEKNKVFNHNDIKYKRVVIVVLILFILNVALYFIKNSPILSGYAVIDNIKEDPTTLTPDKILLIITLIAIPALLIFLYLKNIKHKKKLESMKINLSELEKLKQNISGTDIDVLYALLQQKNEIPLSLIQRVFRINKEMALKWGKILEEHNLAIMNYPAFSEPILMKKGS